MTVPAAHSKTEVRETMREVLRQVPLAVRITDSMELCARLEPQLQSAHTILFFAPLADELDVWPLMEKFLHGKKVCALPAFDATAKLYSARRITNLETDIVTGKFGVSEPMETCAPIPLDRFDLVLVPGVAFDLSGNRLGRGRGFYDRILSAASGVKCGVAYDFQLLKEIPTEIHDEKVTFIFTPTRCVKRMG